MIIKWFIFLSEFYFYHMNPAFHQGSLKLGALPYRRFSFLFTLRTSARFSSLKYTFNMSLYTSRTLISFPMPLNWSLNFLG